MCKKKKDFVNIAECQKSAKFANTKSQKPGLQSGADIHPDDKKLKKKQEDFVNTAEHQKSEKLANAKSHKPGLQSGADIHQDETKLAKKTKTL
jgi:hypothetical protein